MIAIRIVSALLLMSGVAGRAQPPPDPGAQENADGGLLQNAEEPGDQEQDDTQSGPGIDANSVASASADAVQDDGSTGSVETVPASAEAQSELNDAPAGLDAGNSADSSGGRDEAQEPRRADVDSAQSDIAARFRQMGIDPARHHDVSHFRYLHQFQDSIHPFQWTQEMIDAAAALEHCLAEGARRVWRNPGSRASYFNESSEIVARCRPQVGTMRQAWMGMIGGLPISIDDRAVRRMEFEEKVGNLDMRVESQILYNFQQSRY